MTRRRDTTQPVDTVKEITENVKQKRRLERKKRRHRILKRIFTLIVVVSVIVGLYLFDQSEYSKIKNIEIKGNKNIPTEYLLENFELNEGDRLINGLWTQVFGSYKAPGVANSKLNMYYTKGNITLTVEEFPVVAYISGKHTKILLSDNALLSNSAYTSNLVPRLVGFTDEMIHQYPDFSDKLSRMDNASFNSISEIHIMNEPLEDIYFKLIMNNGYFVYTNVDNLLLMNYYSEIVSGIQTGNKPENRCIYFLDYGHTPDNQSAISKPCEE
ncbi:MAG: hypothetical protein GX753_01120 [Erysipelothrix sp.]|nr:hypothetical protein [Erysipelothrix sp.]